MGVKGTDSTPYYGCERHGENDKAYRPWLTDLQVTQNV